MTGFLPATLHGYYRSASSWRVRIALGLKGLAVQQVAHHLRRNEQRAPEFLRLNPQGLVLVLAVTQGMSVLARDGASRASLLAMVNAALRAWPTTEAASVAMIG